MDAHKTKEELTDDKKLATELVSEKENIENEIKDLSEIRDIKDKFDIIVDKVERTSDKQSRLNTEKINLQTQKSHYQLQLDTIEDKVIHYYENEDTIKENKSLDGKVTEERDILSVTNNKLQSTEESFNIVFGKTKVFENKQQSINKTINTVKELALTLKSTRCESFSFSFPLVKISLLEDKPFAVIKFFAHCLLLGRSSSDNE